MNDRDNGFAEKVMKGIRLAAKKLVEETAAKNGSLIVGGENGTIKKIPAKELLAVLQHQ